MFSLFFSWITKGFWFSFWFCGGRLQWTFCRSAMAVSEMAHTQQTHLHLLGGLQPARLHWLLQRTSPERMLCGMSTNKASLCLAKGNQGFRWKEQPGQSFLTKQHSPYWWQCTGARRTEVSSRHSLAAWGRQNTWIFQARFLETWKENIYISNQNISLLRRAGDQNEHFHSLADRTIGNVALWMS